VVIGSVIVTIGVTVVTLAIIALSGGFISDEVDPVYPTPSLEVEVDLSYSGTEERTTLLQYSTDVRNVMEDTLQGYAFMYATNNQADPPLRSLSPPRALSSTNPERNFHVNTASEGLPVTLPPGEQTTITGGLPLPETWHDGTPIDAERFTELQFYVLDDQSFVLYKRTWSLAVD